MLTSSEVKLVDVVVVVAVVVVVVVGGLQGY